MAYEQIAYEVSEGIATITLNRPEKMNAFTGVMMTELIDALDKANKDDAVRAIIFTGAGKAFVAGADIAAMSEMTEFEAREFARQGHALGELLAGLPIPVVALTPR